MPKNRPPSSLSMLGRLMEALALVSPGKSLTVSIAPDAGRSFVTKTAPYALYLYENETTVCAWQSIDSSTSFPERRNFARVWGSRKSPSSFTFSFPGHGGPVFLGWKEAAEKCRNV